MTSDEHLYSDMKDETIIILSTIDVNYSLFYIDMTNKLIYLVVIFIGIIICKDNVSLGQGLNCMYKTFGNVEICMSFKRSACVYSKYDSFRLYLKNSHSSIAAALTCYSRKFVFKMFNPLFNFFYCFL